MSGTCADGVGAAGSRSSSSTVSWRAGPRGSSSPTPAATAVSRRGLSPTATPSLVARFARAGFQCVTHAIGDRAVRETLDAYHAAPPRPGIRHRIEHLELLGDCELRRLVDEQVVASLQPLHMQWRAADGSDEWSRRLGATRAARAFGVRHPSRVGASVALAAESPSPGASTRAAPHGGPPSRQPVPPSPWRPGTSAAAQCPPGPGGLHHRRGASGRRARPGRPSRAGPARRLHGVCREPSAGLRRRLVQLPVALTVVAGDITHRSEAALGR